MTREVLHGLRPHSSLALEIDGEMRLPDGAHNPGQGALLELQVVPGVSRPWRSPSIEVWSGEFRFRQHFSAQARGTLLVDLSPAFAPGRRAGSMQLRAHGFTPQRQATLHLFEPVRMNASRVLVIAPHPDDAEIACFGLYASNPSCIVTLTAGERGMADLSALTRDRFEAARELARLRVDDSLSIPLRAGVPRERCVNLVFPDGALEELWSHAPQPRPLFGHDEPARARLRARNPARVLGANRETSWPVLVDEIARQIDAFRPTHIACPHPLLDSHPDHVFSAIAVDAALGVREKPQLLLYVVHSAVDIRYPFGPASTPPGPPPVRAGQRHGDSVLSLALDPALRARKNAAIAAHHDLREYPADTPRRLVRQLREWLRPGAVTARSLRARGQRPNEFYFVASGDSFSQMCAAALNSRTRRETAASAPNGAASVVAT